jgi:urease beta subunit
VIPGEIRPAMADVGPEDGTGPSRLRVANTGDRPIQVGSHFHFFEVNRALRFDRAAAYGMRLAVPSGTAQRFEPGDEREVELVPLGGRRVVRGLNGLVDGPLDAPGAREAALERARERGFLDPGAA